MGAPGQSHGLGMQEEKGVGSDGVSGMSPEQERMLWAQLSAEGGRVRKEVAFVRDSKCREGTVTLLLLIKKRKGRREGEEDRKRSKRATQRTCIVSGERGRSRRTRHRTERRSGGGGGGGASTQSAEPSGEGKRRYRC